MSKLAIVTCFLLVSHLIIGQDLTNQHKYFNTYGLQYNLNKRSSISSSYTGIGELNNLKFTYHDIGVNFTRSISQKSDISFGVDLIKILQRNTSGFEQYFRTNIEYSHNTRIKKIAISNEFNAEAYFPKFNKYQYRFIYSLDATYRWNITKWKIRPYSKFKLYYYSGGKYLDYYDNESNLIAKKSPNDIHRWRWYWGLKMKPHKQLSLVVSYFWNEEFNAGLFENSNINIYNKNKNGIKYAYNSYGAINLSLTYTLKFKRHNEGDKEKEKEIETDSNKEN
jgi:hypothetical protein